MGQIQRVASFTARSPSACFILVRRWLRDAAQTFPQNLKCPSGTPGYATEVARQLIGVPDLEIDLMSANTWTVNSFYAEQTSAGRVFCMGDAIHRHPPSNGLGSNTSIQDAFNLAWKMAMVLKAQTGEHLLDSNNAERQPVAKQIVTRANQSIAYKKYKFDAHGVEMNQRYRSDAIIADGQIESAFGTDAERHDQPTTWPGARLPHVWVYRHDNGAEVSTPDLTGINGRPWVDAARMIAAELGIDIPAHVIRPRQEFVDQRGDWARASEIGESGAVLVHPDHHVAWRVGNLPDTPQAALRRVLRQILAR